MKRKGRRSQPESLVRVFKLGETRMEPTNLVGTVIRTDKNGLVHVRWNRETTTASELEKLLKTT